ncbi:MAG TPA: FAD-dependent oxidoreductase [Nocardioides sp.]|jgi:3-phenylpropionate/trans-cinnamate dioxygenase ferredoxin reductase subunit|nr:FAD-dependent oxidoreductase [Nocardioides sp.]
MSAPIVLVGGGLASGTAVRELRDQGYTGDLIVIAGEAHPPYERPPLSKGYLLGNEPAEKALVNVESWYAEHDVDLRTGVSVESVDPEARTLRAGGEEITWSGLLLATGAIPRHLALADDSGAPVHYLRTLEDSTELKAQLTEGARIGIIGGGWIGLEVASAARQAGAEVTVLEAQDQPLRGVVGPEIGALFAQLHREKGVDVRTGVRIEAIERGADGVTISLAGADPLVVDRVVVGVGVAPMADLASDAGIGVDNGILVDSGLHTSAPGIFAAGDVANVDHPVLGHRVRVEHWDTAIKHGTVAATNLLGGNAVADHLPYFFTDQYALGLEYVGHPGPDGFDRVVVTGDSEGPVEGRTFRVWWLRGDRVVAGMHVNDWDSIGRVRELVGTEADEAALRS